MEFGDDEINVFPEAIKVELPDESLEHVDKVDMFHEDLNQGV